MLHNLYLKAMPLTLWSSKNRQDLRLQRVGLIDGTNINTIARHWHLHQITTWESLSMMKKYDPMAHKCWDVCSMLEVFNCFDSFLPFVKAA